MGPYTIPGVSPNFTMDQDESGARSFFRGGKYERLGAPKRKYDPDNLFRLNQNIKPSTNGKGSRTGPEENRLPGAAPDRSPLFRG